MLFAIYFALKHILVVCFNLITMTTTVRFHIFGKIINKIYIDIYLMLFYIEAHLSKLEFRIWTHNISINDVN